MERILRQHSTGAFEGFTRHEALAPPRSSSGKTDPRSGALAAKAPATKSARERYLLEQLAQFSSRHFEELRSLRALDAERDRERRVLEWCAQFSSASENQRRNLPEQETRTGGNQRPAGWFARELREGTWDPSKHPRGGYPENRGWWSPAGGEGSGDAQPRRNDSPFGDADSRFGDGLLAGRRSSGKRPQQSKKAAKREYDSSRPYLPSDLRGDWLEEGGKKVFQLKEPIKATSTGEVIRKIEFIDDVPVLHGNPAWGEMPTIALTGNSTLDIDNAQRAWKKLNPNMVLPPNTVFHHDLLRAKTMTMVINGKKTNVVVGVMQLVPLELHKALSHQGSASAARRVYDALDVDAKLVESFAMSSSALGGIDEQFTRLRVAKPLRKFVGRAVRRVVPIVGTAIGLLEFTQNREAHGFVGALARETPVLSDLIGAYDLGSELAKEINDAANEKLDADMKALNANPLEAMILANQQAVEAFQELAGEIEITEYDGYRTTSELVDLDATADALRRYRDAMQSAYYLKLEKKSNAGFDAAAAAAKAELKNRLKGAVRTHVQLTDVPTA